MTRLLPLLLLLPSVASAGVFIAVDGELVNPKAGEKPGVTLQFDESLHRATVALRADDGSVSKDWNFPGIKPGRAVQLSWDAPEGRLGYDLSVEMVYPDGEKYTEETWIEIAVASPFSASIPANSVDMEARGFDVVSNRVPTHIELEVMDDNRKVIGTSTFKVKDGKRGQPTRVTWEPPAAGNIFKVSAKVHDEFGYWAGAEIIPWSLSIPHEDVVFETGKSDIRPEEAPKVDAAWTEIAAAVDKYGDWVQCTLYVGGYTDSVGDPGSNQGLSERRALAIAKYFAAKGASFPIYYQGFGESAQAVTTEDNVDLEANRRATYIITAGTPPSGKDTPRANWRKAK